MIPFNKPFIIGRELKYIRQATNTGHLSGNGVFTQKCHAFFENRYGFPKCLLTTSCTDALEMAAILIGIKPGDEIILPSFTFVSTANAFVLHGATLVFADSEPKTPNLDVERVEELITPRTKAIVVVHYAGIACDMDRLLSLSKTKGITIIEDAAQAIESKYKGKPLGGLGGLGAFSFHETKNIHAGEGGLLVIGDDRLHTRSEIVWEKGTNRAAYSRGEVDRYRWVDFGSSYLPSELTAAFLYAQLEHLEKIQKNRIRIWNFYRESLENLEKSGKVRLPYTPEYATQNAHMFYLVCSDRKERDALIGYLRTRGVYAVFHYLPLHLSPFYRNKHGERDLPYARHYADCLIRLPLFYSLESEQAFYISKAVLDFYET